MDTLPRNPASPELWNGMEVLAHGAHRICVRDAHAPQFCLKFERPLHERPASGLRQRARLWLGHRLPYFGDNRAELRAYRTLNRRIGTADDTPFARSHGLVATPWGAALRTDCVLLADGQPARSLHAHLHRFRCHSPVSLCQAVVEFEQWLIEHRLPLFDLNPGNFVVVPHGDGLRLVCVDAKSLARGKEVLPLSRWSSRLMRRKIRRRAARLRARIVEALDTD